jgi:hypothetical protein
MSVPVFEHGEDHSFTADPDGRCTVHGWECPDCGHLDGVVLHLEPPYGALVACLALWPDPDWGVRRPCAREFLIAF